MMPDDGLSALAGRPGWAASDGIAIFEPTLGGWRAVVRRVVVAGHSYERLKLTIVDSAG
jgi:hypothetical protein